MPPFTVGVAVEEVTGVKISGEAAVLVTGAESVVVGSSLIDET